MLFRSHMDNPEDPSCQTFYDLLDSWGLNQHTHGATRYPGGHTLDLVITRNVAIRNVGKNYDKDEGPIAGRSILSIYIPHALNVSNSDIKRFESTAFIDYCFINHHF